MKKNIQEFEFEDGPWSFSSADSNGNAVNDWAGYSADPFQKQAQQYPPSAFEFEDFRGSLGAGDDASFSYHAQQPDPSAQWDSSVPLSGQSRQRGRVHHWKPFFFLSLLAVILVIALLGFLHPSREAPPVQAASPSKETTSATAQLKTPVLLRENRYFRSQLNASDQEIYDSIYDCMISYGERTAPVLLPSKEYAYQLYRDVLADWPELFWVGNTCTITSSPASQGLQIAFLPQYLAAKSEIASQQDFIDATIAPLLTELSSKSEYEKITGVYTYLVDRYIYDIDYQGNSIYDCLRDNRAVCQGYAKTAQYILNKLNIEAIYVSGEATNSDGTDLHAWNIVKAEGQYYHFDATWGDPITPDGTQTRIYDYCMIPSRIICRTHSYDTARFPDCTALDCNYYVHNGFYLEEFDESLILSYLAASIDGSPSVTFLCDNEALYAETAQKLFDDQRLADIAAGFFDGKAFQYSYQLREDSLVISFEFH